MTYAHQERSAMFSRLSHSRTRQVPNPGVSPTTNREKWTSLRRIAISATLLIVLAAPVQASVSYDFIESGTTTIGATLTFNSPPASADHQWGTIQSSDILDFRLIDANVGTVGSYLATINNMIVSGDGTTLDTGIIDGLLQGDNSSFLVADLASGFGSSLLIGGNGIVSGDWVLEQSLPPTVAEPSSMFMLGIAGMAGLALSRLRREVATRGEPSSTQRSGPFA